MRSLRLIALLAATSLLALGAMARADTLGPTVETDFGGGPQGMLAGVDIFVPFGIGGDAMMFGDLRGRLDQDEFQQLSAGLGWRTRLGETWVGGVYGYYDYLSSDLDNDFHQLSVGAELISRNLVLRANGYLPIGDVYANVEAANRALLEAGRLYFRAGRETALSGVDGEAGFRVPLFEDSSAARLMLYGGGYWYEGGGLDETLGASARAELSFTGLPGLAQGTTFTLAAGATYDDSLEGQVVARLRIPLGAAAGRGLAQRDPFMARVERADVIRTEVGASGEREAAVYADTGTLVGNVVAVSAASGGAGAINAIVTAAGDNALVVTSGVLQLDKALLLQSGQFVLGGQGSLEIVGARSGGRATFAANGAATVLQGTDPTQDVLVMADGSAAIDLSIRGGRDGVSAANVENILLRGVDIGATNGNGIMLTHVSGALIEDVRIHDLPICASNSDCEFSIFEPERSVPNTAISLFSSDHVTIRNVAIDNATYGLFANAAFEENEDYALAAPAPSRDLTVENLTITNTRREAIQLVGVENASFRNLAIDNSAMDRTMDLVVLMSSAGITMDGLNLKGGVNALQFIGPSMFANPSSGISVSNAVLEGQSRSGIMLNMGSTDISFSNIDIRDPGEHGVYLYGPSYSFMMPIENVSFTNVMVTGSQAEAVHLGGILTNVTGSIGVSGASANCVADTSTWASTELVQSDGGFLSIAGMPIAAGALPADCGATPAG